MQHRKNESEGHHFFPASLLEFKFKCDYFFELYKKVIKISKKKLSTSISPFIVPQRSNN